MALDPFAPDLGLDVTKPVAGLDPFAPDPNAPGPFRRGFGVGVAGVKSSLAGAGALVARAIGAKELERAALEKVAAENEIAAQGNQRIEDVDFSSPGAVFDQFKFLLGAAIPSLGLIAAGGIAGRGLGALAGRGAAAAKRIGTLGGAVAPDVALEAGGIFPEALQTGVENPVLRAIAGGTAAASLDFLPLLAAERFIKAAGRGGFGALAKGAIKGAPVGAALEGVQEAGQSAIERLSAGLPLTGEEAVSDIINSFAGGAAPGLVFGAGIGASRGRKAAPQARASVQVPPAFTPPEQPPIVNAPQQPELGLPPLNEDLAPRLDQLSPLIEQAPRGTFLSPGTVVDPFNRNISPEAQDADLTRRDTLATQQAQLQARVAELEPVAAVIKGRKTSAAVTAQRAAAAELETVKAQLGAITPELGAINEAIKTRRKTLDVLAETPTGLNPAINPDRLAGLSAPKSDIIQTKPETEPEAIDRAVKGVNALFKEQGFLLRTTREALAAQPPTRREVALAKVTERAPRLSQKDTSISDKIGERETRAIRTAQAAVEIVFDEELKGMTPARRAKIDMTKRAERIRVSVNAVNSVVQEAAALPTLKERQQRAREDIPKALAGLDKETREAVADNVARTLFSRVAIVPEQQSSAAFTADQFHALPQPAKEAAVDTFNRAMTELGQNLIARLRAIVGNDPNLTISTFIAEPGGPVGGFTRIGPLKSIISMALNAKNALSVADHEGFHFAEDRILTRSEIQIIGNSFKPGRPLFEKLMEAARRSDLENKTNLADEIASIPEESRAYGFEFWRRGEIQVEGILLRIFEQIKQFLARIANAVRGLGFQTTEDIFKALAMGQFSEREKNQAGGIAGLESREAVDTLFSKAAVDMRRGAQEGELSNIQQFQNFTQSFERTFPEPQLAPDNVLTAAFGAAGAEIKGGLSRWWQRNMATTNFVSHFSKGVKNVYRTLNTYTRFRKLLIENMLRGKIPTWFNASFEDQDITFNALLKRTVSGFSRSSPELAELRRNLETPERQRMFDEARQMMDGFLLAELESDRQEWKNFYIAGYESLSAENKAALDAQIEQHKQITPEQAKLLSAEDRVLFDQTATYREEITDRETQVADLIDKGYIPLRRHGDFVVVVTKAAVGPEGKALVVNRMGFESQAKAAFAVKTFEDEIKRQGLSDVYKAEPLGIQHKSARETSISARQFIDTARRNGVPLTQPEIERIVKALTRSESMLRNRLLQRQGTPGFSVDGMRILSEFGVNTAGKIAYSRFASAIEAASAGRTVTSDIVKQDTDLVPEITIDESLDAREKGPANLYTLDGPESGFKRDIANEIIDYVLVPDPSGGWSQKLRGAAMVYFLGGSISGALVNTMSVPMLTVPELSIHTNYYNAVSTTLSSWKQSWQHQGTLRNLENLKDKNVFPMREIDAVPGLREALAQATDVIFDTEVHQIMGIAQGQVFSNSRATQRAIEAWMQPFRISEQMNRATSFIAAYKIGQQNGLNARDLFTFARQITESTQNNYDPANRPGIARNPITAIMFMFKSFPLFMVEAAVLMFKASPKSAIYMLLGLTLMTGVQGLPFAETLQDLIDTIAQRIFNSPFNTRRAMRNIIKQASEAIVGADLSELVLRGGFNAILGISASSRIGAGDFVPGTRLGTAEADQGRILEEVLGAPAALLKDSLSNAGKLVGGVITGDWRQSVDALRAGGPVALRNVIKGVEQLNDGYASDSKGRRLVDITAMSAMFQLIGISSAGLAAAYERDLIDKQTAAFYTQTRSDMQNELARALKDGDASRAQDIWDAAVAWDEANPGMPIRLNPSTIRRQIMQAGLRLNERTLRLLPRQLRATSLSAEDQ